MNNLYEWLVYFVVEVMADRERFCREIENGQKSHSAKRLLEVGPR